MKTKTIWLRFFLIIGITALAISAKHSTKNAGSASELKGKIYSLVLFITDQQDSWTKDEKLLMLEKQNQAQEWLVEQARRYNVDLSFECSGQFGFEEDIALDFVERGTASGRESVDWVSKILYKSGYQSTQDLVKWVKDNTECDQIQVIIFTKGKGNGYAMAYANNMSREKYFVEGTMLYEKYNNGSDKPPASIAHELLHLYGASDLYKTFRQSAEKEKIARQKYPNSIMLKVSYDINELEIDNFTAWAIGWHTEHEPIFDFLAAE
ncbi:MAG: hypothetical protein KDK38_06050 [Leptospiraceae bacterium]|nr:hypothetical protein [Leptospiraceae bacterium]